MEPRPPRANRTGARARIRHLFAEDRARLEVGERDGEGVGGIGGGHLFQAEQDADHPRDLRLLRAPAARDRALHPRRRVLGDGETAPARTRGAPRRARARASRPPARPSRRRVPRLLACVGRVRASRPRRARARSRRAARRSGSSTSVSMIAVRDVREPRSVARDDAPAEVACAGVEAEDDHRATVARLSLARDPPISSSETSKSA